MCSNLATPTADSSGAKGARQAQAVVAALVTEDDVLLLEVAANADVEVLVPLAVLVDAVSATIEGSVVLVSLRLQCSMFTELSCSIQLGQKCWWARVSTLP